MPKRPEPRRPSAGREPLSRERIENTALELIDAVGLVGFSTRKLGERLGCEAMSIYHHYPSKAHLLDALVDRVIASAYRPPRTLAPVRRLRELARGWRAMALAHPRFFPLLSVHRMNSPAGVAYLNEILATLREAGLGRERAARLFRAIGYYLMGAALDEISGYAKGPSSMHPVSAAEIAQRFPDLAAAAEFFAPAQFERTFEQGLDALLAGAGLVPSAKRSKR